MNNKGQRILASSGALSLAAGMGLMLTMTPASAAEEVEYSFPESSQSSPLGLLTTGTEEAPKPGKIKFSADYPEGSTLTPGSYTVKYESRAGVDAENLSCVVNIDGKERTYKGTDDVLGWVLPKETKIEGNDKGVNCTVEVPATETNAVGEEDFHQGTAVFGKNGASVDGENVYALVGNDMEGIYPEDWKPGDSTDKYEWEKAVEAFEVPDITLNTKENQEKGVVPETLTLAYKNLDAGEEYSVITRVYNDDNKEVLETDPQSFAPEKAEGNVNVDISELPDEVKGNENYRVVSQIIKANADDENIIGQDELEVTANPIGDRLTIFQVDAQNKKTKLSGSTYTGWLCEQDNSAEGEEVSEEFLDETPGAVSEAGVKCETLDKYDLKMDAEGNMLWTDDLKVRADGDHFFLLEEEKAVEGYEPLHSKITIMPTEDGKWEVSGGDGAWVDEKTGDIYIPSAKAEVTDPAPTDSPDPTTEPTDSPEPTDPEPTSDPTGSPTDDPDPTTEPITEPTETEEPKPTATDEPTEEVSASPTSTNTSSPSTKDKDEANPLLVDSTPDNDDAVVAAPAANNGVPADSGLSYYDETLADTGSNTHPGILAGAVALMLLGLSMLGGSAFFKKRSVTD